jgi:hypothetical protein
MLISFLRRIQIIDLLTILKLKKMKTKVLSLAALFMLGAVSVFAANKIEKIEVKGNCGMCEKRIEKAASAVNGVSKADWNNKTRIQFGGICR